MHGLMNVKRYLLLCQWNTIRGITAPYYSSFLQPFIEIQCNEWAFANFQLTELSDHPVPDNPACTVAAQLAKNFTVLWNLNIHYYVQNSQTFLNCTKN